MSTIKVQNNSVITNFYNYFIRDFLSRTGVYLVCPVCGNTYDAAAVDAKCAFCGTPKEKFEKI